MSFLNTNQFNTQFKAQSLIIVALLFANSSFAQSTETSSAAVGTSTVQITPDKKAEDKAFTLSSYIELSESIAKDEVSAKENSLALQIAPSYKWNELLTSAGEIVINKDNFGQHETTVSDLKLSLAIKGFKISDTLTTKHSLGTVVPVSEKSVKRDKLQGNISITNGIEYKNTFFTATYKLGLSQNFHEYNINAENSPNIKYRISQILDLVIPITEKFNISASGIYKIGYTYRDFNRYAFGIDLDLNYDFTPNFSSNIGTSNEGDALKANGLDSNINAYDAKSSVVRAGMTYTY